MKKIKTELKELVIGWMTDALDKRDFPMAQYWFAELTSMYVPKKRTKFNIKKI